MSEEQRKRAAGERGRRTITQTGSVEAEQTPPDNPPPDPREDPVAYASWESFPASDAPGWR
jgi:hypothetical protein